MMQSLTTSGKEKSMKDSKEKVILSVIADFIILVFFLAACFFIFGFLLSIHQILAFVFAFFVLLIIAASP